MFPPSAFLKAIEMPLTDQEQIDAPNEPVLNELQDVFTCFRDYLYYYKDSELPGHFLD